MQFIPIKEIEGKNKIALVKFVCKNELLNVQFTSILRKNISDSFAIYINEICPQDLYGIIGIKKTILHILPFVKVDSETALQKDFIQSFKNFYLKEKFKNPVCINGQKDGTELLIRCFKEINIFPEQLNEYNFLKLDSKKFLLKVKSNLKNENSNKNDFTILRCKSEMPAELKNELLELQILYEKEEVVPKCFNFDENLCRLRFSNSLRTQYILALLNNDGKIVSKAGTNAIGFKFVQLGGIFTKKEFRGKNFAKYLLEVLLIKLLKIKKSVVLFVKKQNVSANNLYNSLSFFKISEYLIAYFK